MISDLMNESRAKSLSQREIVTRYIRRRDSLPKVQQKKTFASNPKKHDDGVSCEKLLALAMGTHIRLGKDSLLRLIDSPESGLLRAIALSATTIQVPGQTSCLKSAIQEACKSGLPIQLSAGVFNIGIVALHEMSCDHPLRLKGAGRSRTWLTCSWELRNAAAIFEDMTLLHGEATRSLTP
jgi:hypothetical protein